MGTVLASVPAGPTRGSTHDHGVPAPRAQRVEGERALVRIVGDLRRAGRHRSGRRVPERRHGGGRQLLRQRRGVRRGRVRAGDGGGHRPAGLAALVLRALDQGVLRDPRRGQHVRHPQPQVPDADDGRFARAPRRRLRRPAVLPPARPGHADRRDGVGHVRHRVVRPGPLLGHLRVERVRHPGRLGHRRSPPPAQAGDGAAPVQPVRAREGQARVRPALRRDRAGIDHLEPAGRRPAHRQVPRRRARGQPGRPPRLRVDGVQPRGPGPQRQGARAERGGPTPRLHPGPARHRVVHDRSRTCRR